MDYRNKNTIFRCSGEWSHRAQYWVFEGRSLVCNFKGSGTDFCPPAPNATQEFLCLSCTFCIFKWKKHLVNWILAIGGGEQKNPLKATAKNFWAKLKTMTTRSFPTFQRRRSVSSACNKTHSPLIHSVPQSNAIPSILPEAQHILAGMVPDPVVPSQAAPAGVSDRSQLWVASCSSRDGPAAQQGQGQVITTFTCIKIQCYLRILNKIDARKGLKIYIYKNQALFCKAFQPHAEVPLEPLCNCGW